MSRWPISEEISKDQIPGSRRSMHSGALFWPTPGFKAQSSGFSTDGTLLSASAVPHYGKHSRSLKHTKPLRCVPFTHEGKENKTDVCIGFTKCWGMFVYDWPRKMKEADVSDELVSWCFKPSQPQRITSGLNFGRKPSSKQPFIRNDIQLPSSLRANTNSHQMSEFLISWS